MAEVVFDTALVRVPFYVTDTTGVSYASALHMTLEEFTSFDEKVAAALANNEFENWKTVVTEMSLRKPTKEELQQELSQKQLELNELAAIIAAKE